MTSTIKQVKTGARGASAIVVKATGAHTAPTRRMARKLHRAAKCAAGFRSLVLGGWA